MAHIAAAARPGALRWARWALLGWALAVAFAAAPSSAEIYRWTDESGATRFTNQKPASDVAARHRVDRIGRQTRAAAVSVQKTVIPSLRAALRRRSSGRLVEVPYERVGQLIRVDVRVNESLTAPFYLDTASTFVSITPTVAQALGIDGKATETSLGADTPGGPSELGFVGLDSLEIGGARLENIEGTVNPNLDVGLIGGSFLNRFNYFIDTEGGVILFEPLERPESSKAP
ncbi:MAG: aspartyl protease family protein [Myxococcota bacterium]